MRLIINPKFQAMLPNLTAEEKATLEQSIIDEGCRDALITWKNQIVDGHNRYEICTRLGIPFDVSEMEFADDEAAMDWIDCNQLGRRNLTPDAFRLALGRRYNRIKTKGHGANSGYHFDTQNRTRDLLAEQYGVSPATVARAGKFSDEVEADPVLQDAIRNNVPVKKVKKEQQRQNQIDNPPMPEGGKYSVIYADPPWKYENSGFYNSAETNYPTMTVDEISNLPVSDLATDETVLFLWATNPLLLDALVVMAAWGFEYKTNIAWMKDKARGFGWYLKSKHELLLIGVKPKTPQPINVPDSAHQFTRPEKHSKKPEEFYGIIESMYNGNKVELFARNTRDGWESWGNENVK